MRPLAKDKPYYTFSEYVIHLNLMLKDSPELQDLPVAYASDDEGNCYEIIQFEPSIVHMVDIGSKHLEHVCEGSLEDDNKLEDFPKVVVIN